MPSATVPGGGTLGKCLGDEAGALMKGIGVPKRRPWKAPSPLLPRDIRARRHLWTRQWICWCHDLVFPASKTGRNNFVLSVSYPVHSIWSQKPRRTKIVSPPRAASALKLQLSPEILACWPPPSDFGLHECVSQFLKKNLFLHIRTSHRFCFSRESWLTHRGVTAECRAFENGFYDMDKSQKDYADWKKEREGGKERQKGRRESHVYQLEPPRFKRRSHVQSDCSSFHFSAPPSFSFWNSLYSSDTNIRCLVIITKVP